MVLFVVLFFLNELLICYTARLAFEIFFMKDKVVLITGASSGIGRALALEMAHRGAKIALGARRMEQLEELKSALVNTELLCIKTDVAIESECQNLINQTVEKFGRIDVLINNAGISMRSMFEATDLEVIRRVMDVNFYGTVYCTKFALPHLLASKGSLVGIISIAGYLGLPGRTGYSASKFAVRGFLDTLRIEHLHSGLHVLVAAPGYTASEVRKSALLADGKPQGESPRNEQKMMSAERCAYLITQAIKKRKRTLIMTLIEGKFSVFLSKFFPSLLDKITYSYIAKETDYPQNASK